ncbi:Bug family tripartite tricarboxylate transporter substrate binding protein [Reyranella soli]|uniref:MFS transporter n=1 Tax=Reyranella soli TaxID=1230389 RepID=A0A512NH58_9HYPH|nr:tripartite tricarboxylate transporter substrate binding protein [Reyranella soli]GEP58286.1 MFS transporter [Reyranella soli]
MIKLRRRAALSGLAALPLAHANVRAQTVDFPDRPLRLVVGFPPGGPNDLLARIVAPGIGERLKRSVVVENRAGANGEIAAASVAKSPTDGSVIMLASNGSTTIAPALNPNMTYDIRTDFAAVAPIGINPMLLVVRNDLPAKNVAELLALARAQPGKLNGASAGAGGATHLALELFKSMGKADIVHVPYKGGGPAMADLMAGLVDIYFGGLSTALPHVKAGKMRALGQTSLARSAAAPDIATIAESGLPGYEAAISYGIFLPAGASPALVERLHAAVDATVRSPDVAQKFTDLGADPQFGTPKEFAGYVADDLAKWARLAKQAGLKSE